MRGFAPALQAAEPSCKAPPYRNALPWPDIRTLPRRTKDVNAGRARSPRRTGASRNPFALDPEGGVKGGEIVAEGTPEDVVKVAASYTGHYLKPMLEKAS